MVGMVVRNEDGVEPWQAIQVDSPRRANDISPAGDRIPQDRVAQHGGAPRADEQARVSQAGEFEHQGSTSATSTIRRSLPAAFMREASPSDVPPRRQYVPSAKPSWHVASVRTRRR